MGAAGVAGVAEALMEVDVECTHCGVRMTAYVGSGRRVRYFRCGSCHRWVSSTYAEVFRADAKVRTRPPPREVTDEPQFAQVKDRLERWLAALDEQDPYHVLGLSPLATPAEVRERYRELAFRTHPDRGGSADRMRDINLAYERILNHQARRARSALPPGAAPAAPGSVAASSGGAHAP